MNSEQPPKQPALMSYEEYEALRLHPPFTLELETHGHKLAYFGEAHSFDPADPQWEALEGLWSNFLKTTEGDKRTVFIEGGVRRSPDTRDQSIIDDGGMGLVTWLAKEQGIQTVSPEPNEAEERKLLEEKFSRDEIQYYYFARMVYQWQRKQEPQPDFETYMNGFLRSDERESGWTDYDFSLASMKRIHKEIFGQEFDPLDQRLFREGGNPVRTANIVNRVARASSIIRDEHIVAGIVEYMKEGSAFGNYGFSHVVMQEPLLRALLTK